MNDDLMNDVTIDKKPSPLSVFQSELLKFKDGQKRKQFLYIILPILIIALLAVGYFLYRNTQIKKEATLLDQNIANIVKANEEALLKNGGQGLNVSNQALSDANKRIEETKASGRYGISPEELEKIKNSNQ